jgi:hypothetical protein
VISCCVTCLNGVKSRHQTKHWSDFEILLGKSVIRTVTNRPPYDDNKIQLWESREICIYHSKVNVGLQFRPSSWSHTTPALTSSHSMTFRSNPAWTKLSSVKKRTVVIVVQARAPRQLINIQMQHWLSSRPRRTLCYSSWWNFWRNIQRLTFFRRSRFVTVLACYPSHLPYSRSRRIYIDCKYLI